MPYLAHCVVVCGLPFLTGLLAADSQSLERLAIGHMPHMLGAYRPTVKTFASPYPLMLQSRYIWRGKIYHRYICTCCRLASSGDAGATIAKNTAAEPRYTRR